MPDQDYLDALEKLTHEAFYKGAITVIDALIMDVEKSIELTSEDVTVTVGQVLTLLKDARAMAESHRK